jgi:hypothetical protein
MEQDLELQFIAATAAENGCEFVDPPVSPARRGPRDRGFGPSYECAAFTVHHVVKVGAASATALACRGEGTVEDAVPIEVKELLHSHAIRSIAAD